MEVLWLFDTVLLMVNHEAVILSGSIQPVHLPTTFHYHVIFSYP